MNDRPFSERYGFSAVEAPIQVREDAPQAVRDAVVMLAYDFWRSPNELRQRLCEVFLTQPDRNNWSDGNVRGEVSSLIDTAPWPRVYDFAERLHQQVAYQDTGAAERLEARLNGVFREHGIGWLMQDGLIVARGSEAFQQALQDASAVATATGRLTAAKELHEALQDISRRPEADITGAIQHAMAALECVARDITGEKKTLGQLIPSLGLPKPLDSALEKLWGFASEQGRHIQEGRRPAFEDAELVVTVASAVSSYLMKRPPRGQG